MLLFVQYNALEQKYLRMSIDVFIYLKTLKCKFLTVNRKIQCNTKSSKDAKA